MQVSCTNSLLLFYWYLSLVRDGLRESNSSFRSWWKYKFCLSQKQRNGIFLGLDGLGYVCLLACSVTQSCPTLCDPMDCSPPDSAVHGVSQARILEQFAISYLRRSSWLRDWTHISCTSCTGRWILYHCTTWETTGVCGRLLNRWTLILSLLIHLQNQWAFSRKQLFIFLYSVYSFYLALGLVCQGNISGLTWNVKRQSQISKLCFWFLFLPQSCLNLLKGPLFKYFRYFWPLLKLSLTDSF